MNDKEIHQLKNLVNELLQKEPNQEKVKNLMELCNIPYTNDPFLTIARVLEVLVHFESIGASTTNPKPLPVQEMETHGYGK